MGADIGSIIERKEASFSEVQGTVAIDAYNALYQFLSIIRQKDGTPLLDSEGRVTSHLSGLFYRTCSLLEKGIRPVYVFDGEPSELKKRTIEQRREKKRMAAEEFEAAKERGEEEEMRIYAQQTTRLTREMAAEARQLLGTMGVPVVQAKSEGEAQCAALCSAGLVDAAASQDFDALLFGAPLLIRNLTIAGRRKLPRKNVFTDVVPERIFLKENLERMRIDRRKLVWIGLLVGTDFNEGIRGIGAKKGLKLVQEFDSFEGILEKIGKEMDWQPVERLFLENEEPAVGREGLRYAAPDAKKIVEFMVGRSFSSERVENALGRAFKEPVDSRQDSLRKWF